MIQSHHQIKEFLKEIAHHSMRSRVWCVIANCVNYKHIRYRYKETIMIETFLEGFVFGGF